VVSAEILVKAARDKRDLTKHNRRTTRKQLDKINESYTMVRLRSGLSAEDKIAMKTNFAQQVAQVRLRWNTRKAQIASDYDQIVMRRKTASNFVAEDI